MDKATSVDVRESSKQDTDKHTLGGNAEMTNAAVQKTYTMEKMGDILRGAVEGIVGREVDFLYMSNEARTCSWSAAERF
jgi:hypothetical protein